jgi:hypothetical protein
MVDQFYKKEWYVNIGRTLKESGHTVRYVGRYSKKPVMAESRIESFDGNLVTFSYKDYSDNTVVSTTVTVEEFISRLIRHIPDQHFRNIRHSGIFANRVRTKCIATARLLLIKLQNKNLFLSLFNKDTKKPLTLTLLPAIIAELR